jgi:hypothetical protein
MTIDKAIELLKIASEGWPVGDDMEDYYKALDMGIEALRRVREARKKAYFTTRSLLPGETKENNHE